MRTRPHLASLALTCVGLSTSLACGAPDRAGAGGDGGRGGEGAGGGQGGGAGSGGAGGSGGGGGVVKDACKGGATFGGMGSPWRDPEIQCHYSPPGEHTTTTPLVIDLDGDGKPEIVFQTAKGSCTGESTITAITGDTCTKLWSKSARVNSCSQIAAGDLDGDGKPEIVGYDSEVETLNVWNAKGDMVASKGLKEWNHGSLGMGGGPAIANVDGTGPAEVIMGGAVLRLEGAMLVPLWKHEVVEGYWGTLSLVADVDLDGTPDVVTGNQIFDAVTGEEKTPAGLAARPGGYAAIAQIDPSTAEPEIVLVSSQAGVGSIAAVHPVTGEVVFGPYPIPADGAMIGIGGGPTIADFDGDRKPEIGLAGPSTYLVFDPECAAEPRPAKCAGPGLLWQSPTRDRTSGGTSSSVFDFNCDGKAEVVYRDECWLRIYEGETGHVLAAYNITSGTALEEPVIADVDADGHAEIVVSSDDVTQKCPTGPEAGTGTGWTGYTTGVYILRDPIMYGERWAPARKVWNQNTYHVTNVNEDGSIPAKEDASWDRTNTYRSNAQP